MRATPLLMLACGVFGCVKEAPPLSDAALSYLEDTPKGCEWRRVEPVLGKTETLATLTREKCEVVSIAWSSDATRAIVGSPMEVWLWTGTALQPHELAPPGTRVGKVSFDTNGEPEVGITGSTEACRTLSPIGGDPVAFPCLSGNFPHTGAFPRLRPLDFERVTDEELLYRLETTSPWEPPTWLTTTADMVMVPNNFTHEEVDAMLKEYRRIRPKVARERTGLSFNANALSARGHLAWGALRMPSGLTVAARNGALVFETKDRRAFIAAGAPDAESVWFRGDYLLVLETHGAAPRLYDARTGDLIWHAPAGHGASFWPKLASPK